MSPDTARDQEFQDIKDFRQVMAELEIGEPRTRAVPYIWKWDRIREALVGSEAFDLEEVHRRAFALCNPGLEGRTLIGTTLFASVSVYHPGDRAPVHRHTASASRFALEGTGGYTNVAGERLEMTRGDLVITPNGEWHDHGNDGDEPIFWVDVLDVGLAEHMNAIMTEWDYMEQPTGSNSTEPVAVKVQSTTRPADWSQKLFAKAGIVPRFGGKGRLGGGRSFTPKFMYRAADVREAQDLLRDEEGDPWEGIIVEYTDPTTGRSVVPTLSFRSQLLRPGETTLPKRHTASAVSCVLEGEGTVEIGDQRFEFAPNDVFFAPAWMWRSIANTGDGDAMLYSVSDQPALEKLDYYRAQGRTADGETVDLKRWPDFE